MRDGRRGGGLGTFGGVFTPSILTILGLILFLRLGFVVGSGGVLQAFAILALASLIALLTSISLAAIATNRRVRGGGDYYLISRSLGVAWGGALGLVLFAAQAVSVGFYCVGFAEGMVALLPPTAGVGVPSVAGGAAAVLMLLAYLGANLATRFQFAIMAVLGAALASFFAGGAARFETATLVQNWSVAQAPLGFWGLFAVFFPAVTGFTQGVSMSGELRDPAKSLPLGTFLAGGLATAVYAGVILLLGAALPVSELATDMTALRRVAAVPGLVDGGILAATLSSALASFLGAPRILQALAADRIFRSLAPFAAGHGARSNPRRAVLLTGAIAFATILAGSLNAIAALVSMFFLISYGLLNYATYVEATAASPSFRPRFRFFHARASLLGTLLCAGVMLAIDPVSAVIAAAILVAIHQYVRRTAIPARWRDSRRAYRFRRVREGLREIAAEPDGPSDWQPQVLVFTEGLERRSRVLQFASWITGGSGLVTAVSLVEAEGSSATARRRREEIEAELAGEIEELGLDIYPLAVAGSDLRVAMTTLVQAWGVGPIRSNTVLLNWLGRDDEEKAASAELWYARMLASALRLRKHVIVLDAGEAAWERLEAMDPERRRIDVWWFDDESSRLGILLAHLMKRAESWEDASLRVLAPAAADAAERTRERLVGRLEEFRIDASVEVVADPQLEDVAKRSGDAGSVFLPLRVEGMKLADPFGWDLELLLAHLPVVALVAAAEDVQLTDEEGEPGEATEAEGDEARPAE